jgi:hypothetical protein
MTGLKVSKKKTSINKSSLSKIAHPVTNIPEALKIKKKKKKLRR